MEATLVTCGQPLASIPWALFAVTAKQNVALHAIISPDNVKVSDGNIVFVI